MKLKSYLQERGIFLTANLLVYLGLAILLGILDIPLNYIFLFGITWFMPLVTYIFFEYRRFKCYFNNLAQTMEGLEKKYLLTEVVDMPDFLEGKLVYGFLQEAYQEMLEVLKKEQDVQRDYREYIEMWVHEVKTPIASIGLITKNEETDVTRKIAYEVKRIESYIDQALYYARSSNVKEDYLIKPFVLKDCIVEVVKQYKTDFIRRKIPLELGELTQVVYSDAKWITFIVGQILGNAIKYIGSEGKKIKIYAQSEKNRVVLIIEDEGVGINKKDIGRVFDKGFTGENGRLYGKSTGIGLYLCKQLCNKLGLDIILISEENLGTKVEIIFPIGDKII